MAVQSFAVVRGWVRTWTISSTSPLGIFVLVASKNSTPSCAAAIDLGKALARWRGFAMNLHRSSEHHIIVAIEGLAVRILLSRRARLSAQNCNTLIVLRTTCTLRSSKVLAPSRTRFFATAFPMPQTLESSRMAILIGSCGGNRARTLVHVRVGERGGDTTYLAALIQEVA